MLNISGDINYSNHFVSFPVLVETLEPYPRIPQTLLSRGLGQAKSTTL